MKPMLFGDVCVYKGPVACEGHFALSGSCRHPKYRYRDAYLLFINLLIYVCICLYLFTPSDLVPVNSCIWFVILCTPITPNKQTIILIKPAIYYHLSLHVHYVITVTIITNIGIFFFFSLIVITYYLYTKSTMSVLLKK